MKRERDGVCVGVCVCVCVCDTWHMDLTVFLPKLKLVSWQMVEKAVAVDGGDVCAEERGDEQDRTFRGLATGRERLEDGCRKARLGLCYTHLALDTGCSVASPGQHAGGGLPLTLSLCGASDLRDALALTGHDAFRPAEVLLFRSGHSTCLYIPRLAFRHLPPHSATIGYATEGAFFISV